MNLIDKKFTLEEIYSTYKHRFSPNLQNLKKYSCSEGLKRHQETACIYYNSKELKGIDALRIIAQREPTNIAEGKNQYNKERLNSLFGYKQSVFNDKNALKSDNTKFSELPNTAAVYSETYLWNHKNTKEIACLSLPAPALDTKKQPHYKYYVNENGSLNQRKYKNEINFLFKCIEKSFKDHKNTAFDGKGIQRIVLSKFGQSNFLHSLKDEQQDLAQRIYKEQLKIFLINMKDEKTPIVMSEYTNDGGEAWHSSMLYGDIVETAREGDFIINAWDPHSAPGNGNAGDNSFDGAIGRSTGVLLTQTAWLNSKLRTLGALIPV